MKRFCKFCVFIITFLLFVLDAKCGAVTLAPPENLGTGSGSSGSGGFDARIHPSTSFQYGFRFTLVDVNGNKIPGTRSVDFTGASITIKYNDGINYCGYKYDMKTAAECKEEGNKVPLYIIDALRPDDGNYIKKFLKFMDNDFKKLEPSYYTEEGVQKPVYDRNGKASNFIDYFLWLSGFFSDNDDYLNVPISKAQILSRSIILIEPTMGWTYPTQDYGSTIEAIYGTVTELAKASMDNHTARIVDRTSKTTFIYTNVPALVKTSGLCVSDADITKAKEYLKTGDLFVKNGASSVTCETSPGLSVSLTNFQKVMNTDNGYAVYFGIFPSDYTIENPLNGFSFYSCDYTGGKITFDKTDSPTVTYSENKGAADASELAPEQFKKLENIGSTDDDSGIYCYDAVSYDFSSMLDSLGRKDFNKLSYVNVESGKATIIRKCYAQKNALDEMGQPSISLSGNLEDDYKNNTIKIKFYGEEYYISPHINPAFCTRKSNFDNNSGALFTCNIDIEYNVPIDNIYTGYEKASADNGSIVFEGSGGKGWRDFFGKSNNIINGNLFADDPESTLTFNVDKVYDDSDKAVGGESKYTKFSDLKKENMKCHFSYDFTNIDSGVDVNFRVIALENPFPSRDGTSRMPSKNWLNKENNVFSYITNNRGIRSVLSSNDASPEDMYDDVEPMYSVTLTPSTMIEIRRYNKNYSYYSMYDIGSYNSKVPTLSDADKKDGVNKLECDSNGRRCYSSFLRNSDIFDGAISGTCYLSQSQFNVYDGPLYDPVDQLKLHKKLFDSAFTDDLDKAKYDLNYNNRFDSEDFEILSRYVSNMQASKEQDNTKFYTCANKTYKSGGPVEVEE